MRSREWAYEEEGTAGMLMHGRERGHMRTQKECSPRQATETPGETNLADTLTLTLDSRNVRKYVFVAEVTSRQHFVIEAQEYLGR